MNYDYGVSNQVTYLAVFDGSQTGSTQIGSTGVVVRDAPYSTSRLAEEYEFPNPIKLQKGRWYTVAMGYAASYNTNLPYVPSGSTRTSFSTSYGTISLSSLDTTFGSNQSFTHPSITAFQYNNGTSTASGQLPVIGFLF